MWFIVDCCGLTCVTIADLLLACAYYTVGYRILWTWVQTEGTGYWPLIAFVIFNILFVLSIWSHMACMLTDPGAVPLDKPIQEDDLEAGRATGELDTDGIEMASRAIEHRTTALNTSTESASAATPPSLTADIHAAAAQLPSATAAAVTGVSVRGKTSKRRYCKRCNIPKPPRAHHCSTCGRCILKMDHHCPWVNNCVGMYNQKHFMLFLAYVSILCGFSVLAIVSRLHHCHNRENFVVSFGRIGLPEPAQKGPDICDIDGPLIGFGVLTFFFGLVFGLFTAIMICDQTSAIIHNQTGVEQLQNVRGPRQSWLDSMKEVFNDGTATATWIPSWIALFLPLPTNRSRAPAKGLE